VAFEVHDGRFGGLPTLEVNDPDAGVSAVIALRGATLLSWDPGVGGRGVVDGYADEAEFASQSGVRNGLLAPFSNRVRDGRYTFDAAQLDLLPGVSESERLIYHGFLRTLDCDVLNVEVGPNEARIQLGTSAIRPGVFPGYPFAIDLDITYVFSAHGLTLRVTGRNVGERAAPYGSGWHPYFRLGENGIDHLELHVPARTSIRTDDDLIPLDGARAFQPVTEDERPTFGSPTAVGDAVIDACYADLVPDADGVVRTTLRDPSTGRSLTVWQASGLMHLFTGDTLDRDQRASIALEPVELMTDAFNRSDCYDSVALAPGEERTFTFGVEVSAD
jgi:aldose 1-epimerase